MVFMSGEKLNVRKKEFLVLPFLTLLVMMFITTGSTFLFYQNAVSKDQIRFENEVNKLSYKLDNKIIESIACLKSVRGYIGTQENITPEDFKAFLRSFEVDEKFKSIKGIGYAKKTLPGERHGLIQKMKDIEISDFKIFPQRDRVEYRIVVFLEPQDLQSEREIGFDLMTEVAGSDSVFKAENRGQSTATGNTNLLLNTYSGKQTDFLIYLPVYQDGVLPKNEVDRKKFLEGYVFSSFRSGDFINEIQQNVSKNDVGMLLYDGEIDQKNLFAVSQIGLSEADSDWVKTANIDVAGRNWLVQYKSLPGFYESSEVVWTYLVPIFGILLSLLLFGITYSEARSRLKFETVVAELRKTEKEKARLLKSEKKAREQAERSNRIKDEFLSVISHELRTPLNTIAGWTKILEVENLAPQTKNRALKTIEKNIRAQSELVEELLDFSKINSENIKLNKEEVDFTGLLENSIKEARSLAEAKNIRIHKENNLSGEKIICEAQIIKNALINLIRNAIKFTPKNGKIEIFANHQNNMISLKIKDYGQGIDKKFLPFVFDKFSQADTSTTRKYGGFGLGLAMSRQIIRMHAGDIKVKSEGLGKGTEFIVELPSVQSTQMV